MHRRITGRLVIATHNPGKLAEMRELLAPHGVEVISAGDLGLGEPEETGETFRANAAIKAIAAANAAQLPAFADDSGLVVDALDGAPGIYSARWAGEGKDFMAAMSRIERLLQERGATAPGQARGAFRFRAVRRLARRPPRRGRGARRRNFGLAAARHRRFRLRSGVPARRARADLRRDDHNREARPAAARARPVAPRPRLRQTGGDLPWLAPTPSKRSLRRLRALAVLPVEMPVLRFQQPCPARADRRGALCPRLCARDRNHGGACAGREPSPRSFSAAARRR